MLNKESVYNYVQDEILKRAGEIQKALKSQKDSLKTASESTAGDKHNTSRAMMHIEEEKLGKQLAQLLQLKKVLSSINPKKQSIEVTLGSFIETNKGYLYIAIPLGRIELENTSIMCISLASPIGQTLQSKKAGESVQFNGQLWEIQNVL